MRLFSRKPNDEPVAVCPTCKERVPEDAAECAMCGTQLRGGRAAAVTAADRDPIAPPER